MRDFTIENLTEIVHEEYVSKTSDPRLREIMGSLVNHLHAFVKDIELTEKEWFEAIQFLTATDTNRKKFLIELLKLEEYVEFFEVFKTAAREVLMDINALNAKCSTIVKWLDENKLESIDILPMKKIPRHSDEDSEKLQSLRNDFEKISDIRNHSRVCLFNIFLGYPL